MTDVNVNLLPDRNLISATQTRLKNRLLVILLVATIAFLILSGGSSLLSFSYQRERDNVFSRHSQLSTQYETASPKARNLLTIHSKFAGTKAVLGLRPSQNRNLLAVKNLIPSGTIVTSLSLRSDSQFSLVARSLNLDSLARFLEAIYVLKDKGGLRDISLSGLRIERESEFSFGLDANLDRDKIAEIQKK